MFKQVSIYSTRAQEFGKELGTPVVQSNITERRDPYFREIYNQLLDSLRSNGILRGPRPAVLGTLLRALRTVMSNVCTGQ